jgi:hypothetical protein
MKIKVVKCKEPTDLNFGGWDVLVRDEWIIPGSWACFYEAPTWDDVLALLNGTADPRDLSYAERYASEYLPPDLTPVLADLEAWSDD